MATSKDVWMPGSFLQKWVMETRAFWVGKRGRQTCKILINELDQEVSLSNENIKVEVLRLVGNRYVARDLRQLEAQAFNGTTLISGTDAGGADWRLVLRGCQNTPSYMSFNNSNFFCYPCSYISSWYWYLSGVWVVTGIGRESWILDD